MDLGSLFLVLALFVLVVLFISRPVFEPQESLSEYSAVDGGDHDRSSLLAERDRILNALQELDFDHTLGKIPEEDYPAQRAVLLQRGVDVLRNLDELQPERVDTEAGERLETAVAARQADTQGTPPENLWPQVKNNPLANGRVVSAAVASPDDELEVMLANRRRERQEKAAGFCPQCGGPLQKSDHFCPKCGANIV